MQSAIHNLPANRLGQGEQAAITFAQLNPGYTVALDDRQARLLAGQLKIPVIGTLGIIIKSKRAGLIPVVRPLLEAIQHEGFRMDQALYDQALKIADEF
jgi:predicted nucleic acid-binding protein